MPQNPDLNKTWRNELGLDWQKVQKDYLHTIGNLTLTAYNTEMRDHSFNRKKQVKNGLIDLGELNTYIKKQTTWNEENIEERAGELLKLAIEIWPFPMNDEELKSFNASKASSAKSQVTNIADYDMSNTAKTLFDAIDARILALSPQIIRVLKQRYIAYKLTTNFVDISPRKKNLLIFVNLKFSEVRDPHGICRDVSSVGHHGNGEVMVTFTDESELDNVMEVIKQSFSVYSE